MAARYIVPALAIAGRAAGEYKRHAYRNHTLEEVQEG